MFYLHAFLSRSRLCHTLCLPWACACRSLGPPTCVVAFRPSCDLFGCDHLWDTPLWCWFAWCIPFLHFVRCYACLACFVPPIWLSLLLCIFPRLPTCSCMSLCVIHTPISWNYGHPKPTFVFLGCPLLFDNMFVCPRSAPFDSLSFSMLSFYLFPLSLHVHAWSMDTWSKGATS